MVSTFCKLSVLLVTFIILSLALPCVSFKLRFEGEIRLKLEKSSYGKMAAISKDAILKIRENMLPIIIGCASAQQIPMDKIMELVEKKMTPTVDDSNACFFACIFKKTEMIDAKGMFSEEKAIENSSKFLDGTKKLDKVKEAANNCNSVNEETVSDGEKGCDRAKLLFNCIKEQADKFGFGLPA